MSNPSNPILRGTYDSSGRAWSVDVNGTLAVLADGTNGLVTLNVEDPAHPQYLGHLSLVGPTDSSVDIDISGNTAWVTNGNSGYFGQVNVSAPSAPALVGALVSTPSPAIGIKVYGNHVFVACNAGNSPLSGVDIFTINGTSVVYDSFLPVTDVLGGKTSYQVAVNKGNIYLTDNANLVDVATFYDPAVDKDLALQKSVDKTTVVGGDIVTVTLTMKSTSPFNTEDLVVTDPVIANTTYYPNHATIKIGDGAVNPVTDADDTETNPAYKYKLNSGIPTWNFNAMTHGETITLTYQIKVNDGVSGTFNTTSSSQLTNNSSAITSETPAAEVSNTNTNEATTTSTSPAESTSTPASDSTSALPPLPTPADVPAANSSGTTASSAASTNTNSSEATTSNANSSTTGQTASELSTTSASTSTSDTNQKKTNSFLQFFSNLWKKVKGVAGK